MGFLFKYKSVALFDDLLMPEINITNPIPPAKFYEEADRLYEEVRN
jgi:hypothetical protein